MTHPSPRSLPHIVLAADDHDRLVNIATTALRRDPDVAEELLAELDRAAIVPKEAVPSDVVRMGSAVTFRIDGGDTRTVTLVFPREADMAQNRLSVLTPVGAALIGLAQGQSIAWLTPGGQPRRLAVLAVSPPRDDSAAA